jgi:sulfotransferase
MDNGLHFISGLPRSGSTLLAALLRQNPVLHAAMTSPAGSLVTGLMTQMSQSNEGGVFIDDDQRLRVLRGVIDNFYADIHPNQLVIDTNRLWCSKMALVATLWPHAKVIACVRNPAWILDSVERLMRRNALQPSGIFKFESGGTVYSRAEGLLAGNAMIGFALHALREAVFDPHHDRLMLVRYDSLVTDPQGVLDRIYDFLGVARFAHNPNEIEPDYDAMLFDARIGTPGLHAVGARVEVNVRQTVLPPDLFAKYADGAWWEAAGALPAGVQMI